MANRTNTRRSNWGKVVPGGAGCFLCPPNHPEYSFHVKSVYRDTFFMSLSSAIDAEWLDSECKHIAKKTLNNWNKLPLESEQVKEWIKEVMKYFAHCYIGHVEENQPWNVSNLRIHKQADPVLNQNIHAGVNHIRKYYPEFILTSEML